MAIKNIEFIQIEAALDSLGRKQIGVESDVDSELKFRMWGGKDSTGALTHWLAKNKPGLLHSLRLSSLAGQSQSIAKIDADGNIIRGSIDSTDLEAAGITFQVIDSLTSDSTTGALSAKQGKILKTEIDAKQSKLTSVTASDSTSGSTVTLTIEQGGLSVIDLSAETTLTAAHVVLTNITAAEIPLWWFKIKAGSDITLSVKIGDVAVGWLGSEITNIELGKTVEVSVADGVACGGELV